MNAQALLSRKARATISYPWTGLFCGLSGHHSCSLMRLQNILQSLLHCVVGVGVAGTLLGLVRNQVVTRTQRLVLVLTKSPDRVEDIQEVGRHGAGCQADKLAERRMADGTTVGRAGLQELRRVLQSERIGRDGGFVARAVFGIVMVPGITRCILIAIAKAVIAMVVVTSLTARAGRSGRTRRTG
ncbi:MULTISPECIES: hypothetical protein [unclassified Mesorhizobium]|uniref:hypothetical protein n=1 Tax=unclassified Mesorhizobium TaxID=325217 RepID=UPI0016776385|nr:MULTISPECIES: hypothetical protein [unclassified Mesorhizobium]